MIERGVACTPGYLNRVKRVIIDLHLVRLYKRSIKNKARFNFMSGHQTVEGELRMFICEGQFSKDKSYLAINVVDEENVK